ncbi:MAG: hypothetical protein Tsb0014_07010 [Pleurocapsa sp.]
MNQYASLKTDPPFQSGQIICLEHQDTCLYGEVIQIIPQREQCWFRPQFLAIYASNCELTDGETQVIRLSNSSDLLLPICLFRASWDTEVIPLLSQLGDLREDSQDEFSKSDSFYCQYLHQFIYRVWQANQDKF